MAMKTRAQLLSELSQSGQLPDNSSGSITPAWVRSALVNIQDSYQHASEALPVTLTSSQTDLAPGCYAFGHSAPITITLLAGKGSWTFVDPNLILGTHSATFNSLGTITDASGAQVAGPLVADASGAIFSIHNTAGSTDYLLQQEVQTGPTMDFLSDAVFGTTITWGGTTAPSGTATLRYSYVRVGKLVMVQIRMEWATGGSSLTQAVFDMPAGLPAAEVLTGQDASEPYAFCTGGAQSSIGLGSANITEARFQLGASSQLQGHMRFPSTGVRGLWFTGFYFCA